VSKTAAAMAFLFVTLFSIPMSAQFFSFIPSGDVYVGVSYGQLTDQVNKQSYKGWNASAEFFAFNRFPHLGIVGDGSGYYRSGVTQYLGVGGLRVSNNYGKWRPFAQAMAGVRHVNSNDFIYNPILIDVGGGADYKLWFKNFSWRVQGDYLHSHYGSANQNDVRASTGIVWRF
jgi:hypothetical protein